MIKFEPCDDVSALLQVVAFAYSEREELTRRCSEQVRRVHTHAYIYIYIYMRDAVSGICK
jgi:hypothetical protein